MHTVTQISLTYYCKTKPSSKLCGLKGAVGG